MTKVDENIKTAQNMLSGIVERCYVLEEENKKLNVIIENNELEQKADWKHIEELEEKYEKLKADYIKLSKIVEVGGGYRASYVNELRDKIAELEFYKKQYEHSMGED